MDIRDCTVESFGALLRELRLARGLTQEELAERAGLSVRGLSDLERGVNRRPRPETFARLARVLGLDPSEQAALGRLVHRPRTPRTTSELRSATEHPSLPGRLTSFIGRARELAELSNLVLANRLVTLTGSGGVGKTSLALAVASSLTSRFADGVALAELAAVQDGDLVAHAIAAAVGVPERPKESMLATLSESLGRKALLLVLDNCEHLLLSCARVAETLLRACPRLTILATSRESLRTPPEVISRVPPLTCPPDQARDGLDEYEAPRLFVERAAAARPGFALSTSNQEAVVEICRRLDGIPLAIELAAARVATLPPQEIARHLSDRFGLLTLGNRTALPRHHTLRAVFDWSHDLLSESERALFRRLAVFVGGWTLDGARAVGALPASSSYGSEVFDLLLALVDKSLVQTEERDGHVRYGLLETTREYALEKLDQSGEKREVRAAHASYFASWIGGPGPQPIEAPGQRTNALALDAVAGEIDNLRAALNYFLEQQDAAAGLAMAARIYHLWFVRGPREEGRAWLRKLLAVPSGEAATSRAAALCAAGVLAWHDGALAEAAAAYAEADTLARARADRQAQAYTRTGIGIVAFMQGDLERARAVLEDGARLARDTGSPVPLLDSLVHLGLMAVERGDLAAAHDALAEGRAVLPRFPMMGFRLNWLAGEVALAEGDVFRAAREYAAAVIDRQEKRDPTGLAVSALGLAAIAATTADAARAARLLGWSERVALGVGGQVIVEPGQRARHTWVESAARQQLGEAAFGMVHADGYAMSVERGTAYALERAPELERRTTSYRPDFSPRALPVELSTFIGREHEVARVRELLDTTRLLSLTGPGGIGKTRLALHVATQLQRDTSARVVFVELASVTDPDQLPRAVATALGLIEQSFGSSVDALLETLRSAPAVLVLDNCEHLIGAAATLSDTLLRSCPELRILATTREPLHVSGESVWSLPPLALPVAHSQLGFDQIAESEAVRLFVERAQANVPEFTLDQRNAAVVAQVCRKLDGIPLAIELAAARMTVLTVQQIADRLDDALSLLSKGVRNSPASKHTLRATIDWSYNLLSATEQRLFERLSVFSGGWQLDAAEASCTDGALSPTEVLDALDGLVARSLVLREPRMDGAYRFRLLETIRQYALEKFLTRGEDRIFRGRHADFFVAFAERLQPALLGHGAAAVLDRLEQEHDNLRASLQWLLDQHDALAALRLAGALGRFWQMHCYFAEGQTWTGRALALSSAEQRIPERAKCLYSLGNLTSGRGDLATADAANQEALAIWREVGDAAEEGWTLWALGNNAWRRGDYGIAKQLLEESVAVSRAAGVAPAECNALFRLADVALDLGDHAEAERRAEETLARAGEAGWAPAAVIARRILGEVHLARGETAAAVRQFEASLAGARALGNQLVSAQVLLCLAQPALAREDLVRARQHLTEALELAQQVQDQATIARGLEEFGALAVAAGDTTTGLELLGTAEALRLRAQAQRSPREQRWLETYLARARAVLGVRGAGRAVRAGALVSVAHAIQRAADLHVGACSPENLTAREQEVATLVAQGLSNPQIARELVISDRTVQTHVGNILTKLGLLSRAQVAAWVTEQHLDGTPASGKNP